MYIRAVGALVFFIFSAGIVHAQMASNADVEARVRAYFADTPVMIEIARCESKFRQYTDAGNPFYGGAGGAMIGVFQIHTTVHQYYAKALLGYDIAALDGNLGYAKYLYQTEGTKPWASSYSCWGQTNVSSTPATGTASSTVGGASAALTANLTFGMVHPEVKTLQKILNQKGFTVATEGPGSPGYETEMFGSLTRAAVRKFQCTTLNVCDGEIFTTGYGRVGPRTRIALSSASTVSSTSPAGTSTTTASTTSNSPQLATTSPSGGGSYTAAEQSEVQQLQAQIEELTTFLQLYQTGEQQP